MSLCTMPSGESLAVIAALVAFQLSQGKGPDELALMAAFFNLLGDNLALIAARRAIAENCLNECATDLKKSGVTIDNSVEIV